MDSLFFIILYVGFVGWAFAWSDYRRHRDTPEFEEYRRKYGSLAWFVWMRMYQGKTLWKNGWAWTVFGVSFLAWYAYQLLKVTT